MASYLQISLSVQVNGGPDATSDRSKQPFSAVRASGDCPGKNYVYQCKNSACTCSHLQPQSHFVHVNNRIVFATHTFTETNIWFLFVRITASWSLVYSDLTLGNSTSGALVAHID